MPFCNYSSVTMLRVCLALIGLWLLYGAYLFGRSLWVLLGLFDILFNYYATNGSWGDVFANKKRHEIDLKGQNMNRQTQRQSAGGLLHKVRIAFQHVFGKVTVDKSPGVFNLPISSNLFSLLALDTVS